MDIVILISIFVVGFGLWFWSRKRKKTLTNFPIVTEDVIPCYQYFITRINDGREAYVTALDCNGEKISFYLEENETQAVCLRSIIEQSNNVKIKMSQMC